MVLVALSLDDVIGLGDGSSGDDLLERRPAFFAENDLQTMHC
jgi:hypothetical protein